MNFPLFVARKYFLARRKTNFINIIALLSMAAFASAANMRVIDPLLIQLSVEFGVTVGQASIAATLFLFANGVFVLVHGPFGDRYGKMPVVAIACLAAALCCALSALATSLAMLAAARFLTGVTSSAIIPVAIAWLGDNVPYDKRQATLARFLTGQTLGLMTGAAMGGALGDWLGWRMVFWVLAAIYVVAGAALFAVMRARPELARPGARAAGSMVAQMLGVLRKRWALTVIVVVALEGGVFWGAFTFVGADLHQRFGLGFAAVGLAVAAFGAGGFVGPHGHACQRRSHFAADAEKQHVAGQFLEDVDDGRRRSTEQLVEPGFIGNTVRRVCIPNLVKGKLPIFRRIMRPLVIRRI